MRRHVVIILGLLFALAACGPKEASKLLDGPDTDYGKSLFADLQAKNVTVLRDKMDPKVLAAADSSVFDQMAKLFPQSPPQSVTVVGISNMNFPGNKEVARRVNISLQYEFDGKWLLANAQWRETGSGDKVIEGMHIQPLAMSLQDANAFRLAGKGVKHYSFLALAVVLAVFSIAVLVLCLWTPMSRKRKLLWCIGIIIGFGQISLNWTSGAISVKPISFQLLSAGWLRPGPVGPHLIFVSIPLIAMLFLWRRRQGKFSGGGGVVASESP